MPALVARFGKSKSTIYTLIKDCDASKMKRAAPTRKVIAPVTFANRPDLSKADLGEAARQMITARLMLHGAKVFRPMTEDTPIDLLVLRGTDVLKCQCKYIWPEKKGNHHMSLCAGRTNNPTKKAVRHRYTKDEVDFFLGYCLDNDTVYVFPYEVVAPRQGLTLWVSRNPASFYKVFDHQPWANNFSLLSP